MSPARVGVKRYLGTCSSKRCTALDNVNVDLLKSRTAVWKKWNFLYSCSSSLFCPLKFPWRKREIQFLCLAQFKISAATKLFANIIWFWNLWMLSSGRWKAICDQEIEHENQKIMKLCTRHSTWGTLPTFNIFFWIKISNLECWPSRASKQSSSWVKHSSPGWIQIVFEELSRIKASKFYPWLISAQGEIECCFNSHPIKITRIRNFVLTFFECRLCWIDYSFSHTQAIQQRQNHDDGENQFCLLEEIYPLRLSHFRSESQYENIEKKTFRSILKQKTTARLEQISFLEYFCGFKNPAKDWMENEFSFFFNFIFVFEASFVMVILQCPILNEAKRTNERNWNPGQPSQSVL